MSQLIMLPETRDWNHDLKEFQAFLETEKKEQKQQTLQKILKSPNEKILAIMQLRAGVWSFSRMEDDATYLFDDPSFLDRCCMDLRHTCSLVSKNEWPELHAVMESFGELEARTRALRLELVLKRTRHAETSSSM